MKKIFRKYQETAKRLYNRANDSFKRIFYTEILVIGDSHAKVFNHISFESAFPKQWFNVVFVRGATASGLENPNSKTQSYSIFKKAIEGYDGKTVIVMLGEVDTGFVIWYRAQKYGQSVREMADRAVATYSKFLEEIALTFQVVCISAPLPTIKDGNDWGEVALLRKEINASQLERTRLTLEFNQKVKSFCEAKGIAYVSLDDESIGKDGLVRKRLLGNQPSDHHYDAAEFSELIQKHLRQII